MTKMNKKLWVQVLFFGSIWGILEATIGHVLHFIPATIAGSIMFPIASVILYKAYQKTESRFSLFYIGGVASAIKAVDFLLPQLSVFKTINPMISIVLEALVVVLVAQLLISKSPTKKYIALPIASITWRSLFISWMGLQYVTTGNLAPYIKTFGAGFEFVVISGLLSGLIASLFIYVADKVTFKLPEINNNIIYASGLFIIAIITTYTL
jgi:hypothetical protein